MDGITMGFWASLGAVCAVTLGIAAAVIQDTPPVAHGIVATRIEFVTTMIDCQPTAIECWKE